MKVLRVGDPHVKVNNLEESEALLQFVLKLAIENNVDRIEILGDLFHTHAVLRLEVIKFWEKWLDRLSDYKETVVIEGNHDQTGDYSTTYSALTIFKRLNKKNLIIVTKPTIIGPIGYIPYMHDNEKFIQAANELANVEAKVLVVHQTLQGSKYESGFYASDGADSDRISEKILHIISGHIHSLQEFGRVHYPGTGRWDTVTDANQPKGLWIYSHNDTTGRVIDRTFYSTERVCSPLYQLSYREGDPEPTIPEGRVALELIGTSEWVAKEKQKFKGKVSIKSKITDSKKLESRKAGLGFEDFLRNLFVSAMDREALLKCAKEYGLV